MLTSFLLSVCPNIVHLDLIEDDDVLLTGPEEADEDARREQARNAALVYLATTTHMTSQLRDFRLRTWPRVSYAVMLDVLSRCRSLRNLCIFGAGPCLPYQTCTPSCPTIPTFDFPNLRRVDFFACAAHLAARIIAGAPMLHTVEWTHTGKPGRMPSFPAIETSSTVRILSCRSIRYAFGEADEVALDVAASISALSTFIASFPFIHTLDLFIDRIPVAGLVYSKATPPPPAVASDFFSRLPATVRHIQASGPDILPLLLSSGPYITEGRLPPLEDLELGWVGEMSVDDWKPVAYACQAASIAMKGNLGIAVRKHMIAQVQLELLRLEDEVRVAREQWRLRGAKVPAHSAELPRG